MKETRLQKLVLMWQSQPKDAFISYAIAMEYRGLHNTTEAINWLHTTLQIDKDHIASYFQLGQLHVLLNQIDVAMIFLKKGISCAKMLNNSKAQREMQALLDELLL
jgi:tetratricopeptide (TPR) repeat protein